MKLLLISGHGSGDSGAVGNGYKESDLTIEVVKNIKNYLDEYMSVTVYDTNRNAFKDCQKGQFKIGRYDYILEVHFNAFNGKATGTECFVTTREKGIGVEQKIMKKMAKYFKLRDNDAIFDGVKRKNFLVINTCKSRGMSGCLLEVCFIDNPSDIKIYQENKLEIAKDIGDAIMDGFKVTKKVTSNTKKTTVTKKSNTTIAKEVIAGKWGSGDERKEKLEKAGYSYQAIQSRVNTLLNKKKSNTTIAKEVIAGKWGNGSSRTDRLRKAGYSPSIIQKKVNQLLK
ncbi:N-acetylmuramoyl-L-alanine amidase [Tannockella kyphosi]|uniref:N-acetylmuramoyl-L-alanine amidase n=1 Tax=Tannockella kyphosi TaxID=2899121 RepID=UPI0020123F13|nr:N-acetylmuramoyl-L-alanine amidase [Tannockella kyphosi]